MTPWQASEIRHAVRHTHGEYESRELIKALDKALEKDNEYQILVAAGDSIARAGSR